MDEEKKKPELHSSPGTRKFDATGGKSSNPMQDAIRESGSARRRPDGSYQTNEGTVWLMSPADQRRAHLMRTAKRLRRPDAPIDLDTVKMARLYAKDPELDIDWGIYGTDDPKTDVTTDATSHLELVEQHVGGTIVNYTGRCRGGPYNTGQMTHGERYLYVALDAFTGRAMPAVQKGPMTAETYTFGRYGWNETTLEWDWSDPGETVKAVEM